MRKTGIKYSLIIFSAGLTLWYASPDYFYEQKPHELIEDMYHNRITETFWHDINSHALPSGIFTRPMTYLGLAGLVVSLIVPKKKEE